MASYHKTQKYAGRFWRCSKDVKREIYYLSQCPQGYAPIKEIVHFVQSHFSEYECLIVKPELIIAWLREFESHLLWYVPTAIRELEGGVSLSWEGICSFIEHDWSAYDDDWISTLMRATETSPHQSISLARFLKKSDYKWGGMTEAQLRVILEELGELVAWKYPSPTEPVEVMISQAGITKIVGPRPERPCERINDAHSFFLANDTNLALFLQMVSELSGQYADLVPCTEIRRLGEARYPVKFGCTLSPSSPT